MGKFDSTTRYVFASYSHANAAEVEQNIELVNSKGFNIIYDEDDSRGLKYGDEWDIKVRKYISSVNCRGVVVFISEASVVSRPVLREIDYAKIYHKDYIAIVLDNNSPDELFERVRVKCAIDDNKLFIAETIHNYFPNEKKYLKAAELPLEHGFTRLSKLFVEWGLFRTWQRDTERIKTSENERARLQTQADGYLNIDEKVIGGVMDSFVRDGLVVMDLGCADGHVAFSRFSNNRKIKKVIGIDIKSGDIAKASEQAKTSGLEQVFHFYTLDLDRPDAVDCIRDILKELKVPGVDIVFSALTVHYLRNAEEFLKNLHNIFSKDGRIILRGSDDGTKIVYPDSELLDSIIERYNHYSVSDRYNGRKFYYQLIHAGFRNIRMSFDTTDTSGYDISYREAAFHVGMDFRKRTLERLAKENPGDTTLQEDYKWMCSAIDELESRFYEEDFWYFLVNFVAVAEA